MREPPSGPTLTAGAHESSRSCTFNLTVYLLVEVLVDFLLVGESQHAADHARVFDGPSHVADLRPAVFVFHLHDALRDGQPLLGHGDHGPETHLLYLVFIDVSLFGRNQGRLFEFFYDEYNKKHMLRNVKWTTCIFFAASGVRT